MKWLILKGFYKEIIGIFNFLVKLMFYFFFVVSLNIDLSSDKLLFEINKIALQWNKNENYIETMVFETIDYQIHHSFSWQWSFFSWYNTVLNIRDSEYFQFVIQHFHTFGKNKKIKIKELKEIMVKEK